MVRDWRTKRCEAALVDAARSAWRELADDPSFRPVVGAPPATADLGGRCLARRLSREAANEP